MKPRTVICQTCNAPFVVTNPRSRQTFCSKACRPGRKPVVLPARSCGTCHVKFVPTYECQQYCCKDCKWKGFSASRKVVKQPIECQTCGKEFIPRNETRKFCSVKCARNQHPHVTRPCEICGIDFTTPYRFREVRTCGPVCNGERQSRATRNREVKQCLACNKDFTVVQSYKDDAKYCSYDCFLSTRDTRQPDVKKICEGCKKEFTVPFTKQNRRFCDKSCANSGENNAMFGKPGAMIGKLAWNHGLTAKTDERIRALGEKISVIIANKIVNGEWKHGTGFKGEHFTGIKNGSKQVYLRSSYESIYARILDEDVNVVKWEHEPMRIPYMFEGSIHNYVPDFLVTSRIGSKYLVEVKPALLADTAQNLAKQKVAAEWCKQNDIQFLVVTEKDLS